MNETSSNEIILENFIPISSKIKIFEWKGKSFISLNDQKKILLYNLDGKYGKKYPVIEMFLYNKERNIINIQYIEV